ncbi:MAG: hypothetical protein ACYSWQ_12145 [Planctomycetota bacterium]
MSIRIILAAVASISGTTGSFTYMMCVPGKKSRGHRGISHEIK